MARRILLVLVFCSGCLFTDTLFIESQWPIIEAPPRPTLSGGGAFTPREQQLVDYSIALEAKIKAYNREAMHHNAESERREY